MATAPLVIANQAEHERCDREFADLVRIERKIAEVFAPWKAKANEAHKAACAAERAFLDPISRAKSIRKAASRDWEIRETARAEQERLDQERALKAAQETAAIADAEAAEDAGDPELAERIIEEAAEAPAPMVIAAPRVAHVEGVSTRKRWVAEVHDLAALQKYVGAHTEAAGDLLFPNMPALNARARALGASLKIPGVHPVQVIDKPVR
jgi:hypothetical protein